MPFKKKTYRKKKRVFRRRLRRGKQSIARGVNSAAVLHFKRNRHEIVSVGTSGEGWLINDGSTGMYKTFDFKLSDLTDNSDFINLFRYYKINCVRVKIWPCNTNTGENTYSGQFPNSQLLVRYDQNQDGVTTGAGNQANYQCSQTSKQRRLINGAGKPLDILMRVKQSNMVYKALSGASNTAYSLMRPKWVQTSEPTTAHYGLNMLIHRMSDDTLSAGFTNQQKLRIEYTYYISCKKVE